MESAVTRTTIGNCIKCAIGVPCLTINTINPSCCLVCGLIKTSAITTTTTGKPSTKPVTKGDSNGPLIFAIVAGFFIAIWVVAIIAIAVCYARKLKRAKLHAAQQRHARHTHDVNSQTRRYSTESIMTLPEYKEPHLQTPTSGALPPYPAFHELDSATIQPPNTQQTVTRNVGIIRHSPRIAPLPITTAPNTRVVNDLPSPSGPPPVTPGREPPSYSHTPLRQELGNPS